jgi:hypothetical protein
MKRRLRILIRVRRLHRLRGSVSNRRPLLGNRRLAAVTLGLLALATVAVAYWSAAGSGSATGSVATLTAPSISDATPGTGTVALTWTSVTPPGSGPVTYYVSRDGGAPSGNCPTSSAPAATTSCTDSAVPSGTHQYTVTAVWRSWTAKSASKSVEVAVNPTVTSTSPSSRGQGATNQTIAIKGTNYQSGAQASFSGSGITVDSTSFVSATEVTANISISSGATPGGRTVTVTNPDTSTGTSSGNVFTVNAGPNVTSTSPSSRGQGASGQTVKIIGTGFASGATASFGSGISVESTTFVSATELSAKITVEAGATTGARTVTVTNADAGVGSASAFAVNARPTVEAATPGSGDVGGTENVTVKGTGFVSGVAMSFGSGVKVNSTAFESATQAKVSITVEAGASTGTRTITATNPDAGTGFLAAAFTVNGAPTVTSASPSSGAQGGTQNVAVKGTNFESGASVSVSGTGVKVNSTSFVGATELTANITVESGAATGARTVTITNPDTTSASLSSGFTVTGKPTVTSTSPSSRGQGASSQNIAVKGTNFASGASVTFSGTGITVNSTSLVSATEVTANITIASNATTGARTVTVTNPDTTSASLTSGFTVNAAPTVESTSPSSRGQGATSQTITIKGKAFVSGASVAFSGTGITVNSTTFVSATELKANITVDANAATGARAVTVTNPDAGAGTLANAFTVNPAPTVESTSPSSRGQGAASQTIAIKGKDFVSGASVAFSGTGITVNSTTFVSATELKANITIAATAPTGARAVTVTNPDAGAASLESGFTVNSGPSAESISPSSGDQGGTETVTISGASFVSGASVSVSGTGITVNSTTFVSATELKASITIAAGASIGARTVTVTNPDAGVNSLTFTVNGAPTVTSTSPNSGDQGGTQTVAVKGTNFESGASVSVSGSGVNVNSTSFVSATELSATITVTSGAATGARTVTVTNPDTTSASLASGFTVNAKPTVTSTSPGSRGQGASSQNIAVKGTNFESGASASFSGTGITVNSTSFVSATEVTANITIASNATTGARTVTVTNPDTTSASLTSGFTVNAGPTITSPTKASPINPGHNGEATFTMTGTNFVNGLTVTGNGTAEVQAFKWLTSTTISVTVKGHGENKGLGSFTVTNPDAGSVTSEEGSFKNGT